jgi:hypothetical protein
MNGFKSVSFFLARYYKRLILYLQTEGSTNTLEALQLAFKDPTVEGFVCMACFDYY